MALRIFTGMFIITTMYLIFLHNSAAAAPGNANVEAHHARARPFSRLLPRGQYSRLKNEPLSEFIVDDDDLFELAKRQQPSDDYGHLRFGKRDDAFDDYGHMRFGRGGSSDK